MSDSKQSELEIAIRQWISESSQKYVESYLRECIMNHETKAYRICVNLSQFFIYDADIMVILVTKHNFLCRWILWYYFEFTQKTDFTTQILRMFRGVPTTYFNISNKTIRTINRYVKPDYIDLDAFKNFNDLPNHGVIVTKEPNYTHYKLQNKTIEIQLDSSEMELDKSLVYLGIYLNVMDKSNKIHIKVYISGLIGSKLTELLELNTRHTKRICNHEFVKEFIAKTCKRDIVDILARFRLEQLITGGLKSGAALTNHPLSYPGLMNYVTEFL